MEEDELRIPYLVFRAWRDYYDELGSVQRVFADQSYQQGQKQLHQARKCLMEGKRLLLQRGMAVDDDWMREMNAALLDNLALTDSLINGNLDFFLEHLQHALTLIESYRDQAGSRL